MNIVKFAAGLLAISGVLAAAVPANATGWAYNTSRTKVTVSGTFASNLPTMELSFGNDDPKWPQNWSNESFYYSTEMLAVSRFPGDIGCGIFTASGIRCGQIFYVGGRSYDMGPNNVGQAGTSYDLGQDKVSLTLSGGDEFARPGAFRALITLPLSLSAGKYDAAFKVSYGNYLPGYYLKTGRYHLDHIDMVVAGDIYANFWNGPTVKLNDVTITVRSGVPEPGSWSMLILGFVAVGSVLRRNRLASRMGYSR